MDWRVWINKRIFVKLKTSDVYSGIVLDVENDLMKIKDKFGEIVIFLISNIEKIKEESR